MTQRSPGVIARGIAILAALLLGTGGRSLGAVLLATSAIHLVDGVADLIFGNLPAALGSIVVAALSVGAGLWLLREPDRETRNPAGSSP